VKQNGGYSTNTWLVSRYSLHSFNKGRARAFPRPINLWNSWCGKIIAIKNVMAIIR
ncbi:unnamed protein product, partial [marine sediment metagenome]